MVKASHLHNRDRDNSLNRAVDIYGRSKRAQGCHSTNIYTFPQILCNGSWKPQPASCGKEGARLAHERIIEHYLRYSSIGSRDELEKYLLRDVDTWLSPDEAVRFGITDIIESLSKR